MRIPFLGSSISLADFPSFSLAVPQKSDLLPCYSASRLQKWQASPANIPGLNCLPKPLNILRFIFT